VDYRDTNINFSTSPQPERIIPNYMKQNSAKFTPDAFNYYQNALIESQELTGNLFM